MDNDKIMLRNAQIVSLKQIIQEAYLSLDEI